LINLISHVDIKIKGWFQTIQNYLVNPFNPLSANLEHTPQDDDVIFSGCSASYRQNH